MSLIHLEYPPFGLIPPTKNMQLPKALISLAIAGSVTAFGPEDAIAAQHPLGPGLHKAPKRPNIVFILTDDQDLHMNSLDYLPHIKRHISDRGTHFKKHFCSTALCCPSRVTLWTGKLAHNTNVTDVNPPYGKLTSMSSARIELTMLIGQAATQSSLARVSMRTISLFGSKRPVITHTTLASFSTLIKLIITISLTPKDGQNQISYWILIHMYI